MDALLQLALECDIRAFYQCPAALKLPGEVIGYFCSLQRGGPRKRRKAVRKLLRVFFPPQICDTAQLFLDMKTRFDARGDFDRTAGAFATLLRFPSASLIEAAAAVAQRDPWLEKAALETLALDLDPSLVKGVLSLHSLGRGHAYDIERVLSAVERRGKVTEKERVKELARLLHGELHLARVFCERLGIASGPVV